MRYITTLMLLLISSTANADWYMATPDYGCRHILSLKGDSKTPEEVMYKIRREGHQIEIVPLKKNKVMLGVKTEDIFIFGFSGVIMIFAQGKDQCKKLIPLAKSTAESMEKSAKKTSPFPDHHD